MQYSENVLKLGKFSAGEGGSIELSVIFRKCFNFWKISLDGMRWGRDLI